MLEALVVSGLVSLAFGAPPAGAGALSSLPKGAEIDVRSCTYGPDETHAGRYSGQYLVDRNAYYAIVFVRYCNKEKFEHNKCF